MKTTIFFTILILILSGCSVKPSELTDEDTKSFISKVKYGKDKRTGLCFAIVSSRKATSVSTSGIGITNVPCDKVNYLLVK